MVGEEKGFEKAKSDVLKLCIKYVLVNVKDVGTFMIHT